jgi:ubiquinone/menaquinone biosynthesis C-methylase UbiE
MSVKDADGTERRVLLSRVDFAGKRVLEVGAGDGRVTWMYAADAAETLAIDTDEERIETARRDTPAELVDQVRFEVASAVDLEVPRHNFDLVFLSWSL